MTATKTNRCAHRAVLVAVEVAILLSFLSGGAAANERRTWQLSSRCIDPIQAMMADPPPGKPARPAALRADILLPKGYDGKRRFPVLYLLHGAAGAWDYWMDYSTGELAKALGGLDAIVVIPEGSTLAAWNNWYDAGRRRPCFERHVLEELVPLVERRLKVRAGRRWHAVGGFSGGGLGAMNLAARKPGYFGQALSFSAPLDLDDPFWKQQVEPNVMFSLAMGPRYLEHAPFPLTKLFGDPVAQSYYWKGHNPVEMAPGLRDMRLYVAHGGTAAPQCVDLGPDRCALQDTVVGSYHEGVRFRQNAETFVKAARAAGADVTYRPSTGGHWYSYSARFLADAINDWGLFQPVPRRATSWTYKTVSQSGDMWGLRFEFQRAPETLETFERAGKRLSGSGAGKVRIFRPHSRCSVTATLPFSLHLPTCLTTSARRFARWPP